MNHLSRLTALATLMLAALPLQAKDLTVSAAASLKMRFRKLLPNTNANIPMWM